MTLTFFYFLLFYFFTFSLFHLFNFFQNPAQLVAPRAVRMAVAMLATICTIHLNVSFFVILLSFNFFTFYPFHSLLFNVQIIKLKA